MKDEKVMDHNKCPLRYQVNNMVYTASLNYTHSMQSQGQTGTNMTTKIEKPASKLLHEIETRSYSKLSYKLVELV